jgi:hypothetical protein
MPPDTPAGAIVMPQGTPARNADRSPTMPEGMNVEVAHKLSEQETPGAHRGRSAGDSLHAVVSHRLSTLEAPELLASSVNRR